MITESDDTGPRQPEGSWLAPSLITDLVEADISVVFRSQPRPVAARHRMVYRTALLVLVLSRFHAGAAKSVNLHTIMWAMRSAQTRQMLSSWWQGRRPYFSSANRIDPDLDVTLNLALIDELIAPRANRTRVQLTEHGWELVERIDQVDDLLVVEKTFLDGLNRLSDTALERRLSQVMK